MAGQVIELDVLLKGMAKDRERVMAFLDRMTDLTIAVAKHYEDLGVDYYNGGTFNHYWTLSELP